MQTYCTMDPGGEKSSSETALSEDCIVPNDEAPPADTPEIVHDAYCTRTRHQDNVPMMTALAVVSMLELGLLLSVILVRRYGTGSSVLHLSFPHNMAPFRNYTTVSDTSQHCSHIPGQIYARKGTVADCAVAYALCMAVVAPHRMGLGGGFFLTLYIRSKKSVVILDAREAAPRAINNTDIDSLHTVRRGGKAAAIPGLLRGLEVLHSRFGKLPWAFLFEEAVKMARYGFPIYHELAMVLAKLNKTIFQRQSLRHIFWNPTTQRVYAENETLRQPALAITLLSIAREGYRSFTHGEVGAKYIKDVKAFGGHVEREDFEQYNAVWKAATASLHQGGTVVLSPPPPGGGPLLAFILQTMDMFRVSGDEVMEDDSLAYHRLLESFKFAHPFQDDIGDNHYEDVADTVRDLTSKGQALKVSKRIVDSSTYSDAIFYVFDLQLLRGSSDRAHIPATPSRNDEDIERYRRSEHRRRPPVLYEKLSGRKSKRSGAKPLDVRRGAANAVFVSPGGDVLAFSGSLGMLLGSKEASHSTGIVLNTAMTAFTPRLTDRYYGHAGVSLNHARPGKRPMSALAPTIVLDRDSRPVAAIAAAEITNTPQYTAMILCRLLFMNKTIMDAIDEPKIRFRASVKGILYDVNLRREILQDLQSRGHKMLMLDDTITNAVGVFWDEDHDIYPGINENVGGYYDGD